ncbi:MAG: NAD(P)-binding protein [Polyangiales bacterium]
MKQRIAVLGGGMGSLVTVFELTSLPGWREQYDITVYQEGWRLGGKGASGRNAAVHQRIEEHGLHILFGFYDNAFRVMRECYQELGRHPDAPLSTIEKAFEPADLIVMMEQVDGVWEEPWKLEAPRNSDVPGVGPSKLDGARLLEEVLSFAAKKIEEWVGLDEEDPIAIARNLIRNRPAHEVRVEVRRVFQGAGGRTSIVDLVFERFSSFAVDLEQLGEVLFVDVAHKLAQARNSSDFAHLLSLIDRFDAFLWSRPIHGTKLRRLRMMIDFSLAVARGLIADGLVENPDWFSIDDLDLRAWLKKHGAHEETVQSPMVMGLYDAAFSTYAPSAAGTSLHGFLRMALTYKGAIMYKMQSGMGDTIFAPLYEVLRRRGVKFEFFQQVQSLGVGEQDRIEKIRFRKQATPRGEYRPLVDVNGLPCWPSAPLFDQLLEGAALRDSQQDLEDWWTSWPGVGESELLVGRDFDAVVLGISIGAFPYIAKELMDRSPRFRAMVDNVKTTQTQCFQLWLRPDLARLGWEGFEAPVTIPYGEPFDTWADMSHLLKSEAWPTATVGHLAYMCSAMEDDGPLPPRNQHDYAKKQNDRCKANAIDWLKTQAGTLWPGIATTHEPKAIELAHVVDFEERVGEARFDAQYWRAPYSPSERYVLAVPGSNRYRLRADESGFSNLFMCGDWTKTALSVGCLESATMGGIQAARAIDPRVDKAHGDWLPERSRTSLPQPQAAEPVVIAPAQSRRANRELPAFIETDANQVAAPPIKIGVRVSMFLLDADLAHLRAICDRQLNLPGSPVRYEPLGPFCVLYCSHVDNYPQKNPIGWVPEKDFGIWMPVVAGRGVGPLFVAERVVTYTPYIWVDNGVALIGGRTVFGFAKQLGSMRLPEEPGENAEYSLDTLVVPKYGQNSRAEQKRVLTVRRRDQGVLGELTDAWRSGENVIDAFGEALEAARTGGAHLPVPSWSFVRQMLDDVAHAGMRMVFLKQFPDAVDGSRACYQAIVESDLPIVGSVKGGYLAGNWEAEIRRYDSHRIVETLGLRPRTNDGEIAVVPSLVHGWAKFDAMVNPGTIVHQTT